MTKRLSGSLYVTSNDYFHQVCAIEQLLSDWAKHSDLRLSIMAKKMKEKFDKYWECYSMVLSFAIILDPRYKIQYVEFCFNKLCPETREEKVREVRDKLNLLFEYYTHLSPSASLYNSSSSSHATSGGINDEMDVRSDSISSLFNLLFT